MLPRVLPLDDEDISAEAGKILGKQMTIHTGARTEAVLKTSNGVEVGFKTAAGEAKSVTADLLLMAVGRGPVTDGLGLESTKVQLDRGFIKVDPRMATAVMLVAKSDRKKTIEPIDRLAMKKSSPVDLP